MTVRGTAFLVLLAMALASFAWLEGGPVVPRAPAPVPEGSPLLDTPITKVGSLEWERDADRFSLVRTPAGWVDATGQRWPADVVEVTLDALASLHPRPVAAVGDVALAEYGLAPPQERLRVLDDTGRELVALDIGSRNPAWTGVYARRAGATDVLLVGSLLRWELDKLRSARMRLGQP
jgi:hypothetical protein